jgi:hypothetical protein
VCSVGTNQHKYTINSSEVKEKHIQKEVSSTTQERTMVSIRVEKLKIHMAIGWNTNKGLVLDRGNLIYLNAVLTLPNKV